MNGGSGQDSVTFFVLRSLRNRPTLNETGFVTVTLTKTPGVFSWFEGALRAWSIHLQSYLKASLNPNPPGIDSGSARLSYPLNGIIR